MPTYLITGGAGFIGSHLCDELLRAGNKVMVIDDLSTGDIGNIAHHLSNPNFSFHQASILEFHLMEKLVTSCDYIFHLASVVGVQSVIDSQVRTIETCARGMNIVLTLASRWDKTVLFTSTSEVYGKSAKLPYSEDDDLVFGATHIGRWSYGCGKALDEFEALAYHREKNLRVVVVRLFNTVGPRQTGRYGMVMPKFVANALADKPITVYGDGSHRRCFGYVKDVTAALQQLITHEPAYGKVFNIGSGEEISVLELAHRIKEQLGSRSEIEFVPFNAVYGENFEETIDRVPDIRRIREAIGYNPTTTLAQIIDLIADSLRLEASA